MKELSTKELITHLQDAVSWLLPVSLIVITFLILFFGISEQVGNLKVYSTRIAENVATLKDDVAQLKGADVPAKVDTSNSNPTIRRENAMVSGVKVSFQKLQLTGNDLWGYTFMSDSKVLLAKRNVIEFNGTKALVVEYKNDDNGTLTPFDLYTYTASEKAISNTAGNSAYVLVFVDGKVVLYHDFVENSEVKAGELLNAIAVSTSLDAETKAAAQNEKPNY